MLLNDDELCTQFIKASVISTEVASRVLLFRGIVALFVSPSGLALLLYVLQLGV